MQLMLPEDVFEEILSRFPVKTLLRFRCVCKQWNTLISSSRRFASLHLKRSLPNPTMHFIIIKQSVSYNDRLPLVFLNPVSFAPLAAVRSSDLDPYPPVKSIDPHKQPIFVGSINGLVCLRSLPKFESDWIGIWNPSTKTIKEIIPVTKADYYAVAFGWDPIANDHKVFRFCRSLSGSPTGWVEVWSVRNPQFWRSFRVDDISDVLPICSGNLIMEGGHTYCLVGRGERRHGELIKYRDLIASFDMVREAIRFIRLPLDTDCDESFVSVVNWKGTLALIEKPGYCACQVWTMDKDSESWTKSFTFDLTDVRCIYKLATSISPTQVLISDIGQLHLYDLETRECQKIRLRLGATIQACYHVETLF